MVSEKGQNGGMESGGGAEVPAKDIRVNPLAGAQSVSERMRCLRATRTAKPAELLNPFEKAARNPKSKGLAIAAKCYDCEGQDSDPGWKWRIGNCRITTCGLWLHRPYKKLAGKPVPPSLIAAGFVDATRSAG